MKSGDEQLGAVCRRGLRPAYGVIDRELWMWYCNTRNKQHGTKISKSVVQARAKWAFHQAGITQFKASDGWYRRWISRWHKQSIEEQTSGSSDQGVHSNSEVNQQTVTTQLADKDKQNLQGGNGSHNENNITTASAETALSTPMLNIVDYLPPEIVNSLEDNLAVGVETAAESAVSDKMVNGFSASDIEASMESLYCAPNCEISLQDAMLSQCENMSNFPFELQGQSFSSTEPMIEAARLRDINSEEVLQPSADKSDEDLVQAIFRDVDLENGSAVISDISSSAVPQECPTASSRKSSSKADKLHKKSKKKGLIQRKKGERYLPQFKLKVLAYANTHSLKDTARKFRVNDRTISGWKQEKEWRQQQLENRSSSTLENIPLRPADQQLIVWLRRCREQGRELTPAEVKEKAHQLAGVPKTPNNATWFSLWIDRFDKQLEYHEGLEDPHHRKQERHIQYPAAFKREVAEFAEKHSQLQAARTFTVSRKRVFEWLQNHRAKKQKTDSERPDIEDVRRYSDMEEKEDTKKATRRSDVDKEVDERIWSWYQSQLTAGKKPSGNQVRAKGMEVYQEKGNKQMKCSYQWYKRWCSRYNVVLRHEGDDAMVEWALTQLELGRSMSHSDLQAQALAVSSDKNFKASIGWAIRFCKRHPALLQENPTLDTSLPAPLLTKVQQFRSKVQDLIHSQKLSHDCIGNMDELHLNFSALVTGSSTNPKRQLLLRRADMENCHATIVLTCLADGNLLPPTVILKGAAEVVSCADGEPLVLQQEEAVMDETTMQHWHVVTPNLLLVDCYGPHTAEQVTSQFSSHHSNVLVIPGGCTSKLQPLDISLKKSFHRSVEQHWSKFNSKSNETWEKTKLQLPGRKEIVEWVSATYQKLQVTEQETVRRSFLVTGLTVASNHSEDHFIDNSAMIPPSNSDLICQQFS